MPTIQVEAWEMVQPEISRLCHEHWKEIAHNQEAIPLDPNWGQYQRLADAGMLFVTTIRDEALIGYLILIVSGHLHYKSTLHATEDIFWLAPEYRRGFLGVRLFRFTLTELKRHGVVKAVFSHKLAFQNGRVAKLFEWLGMKAVETVYTVIL